MIDFSNIIAEKYDLEPDATKMFMELLGLVEVAKNSHLIEKGAFNDNSLKKLASYIHLAPQSLSRIRSQIK